MAPEWKCRRRRRRRRTTLRDGYGRVGTLLMKRSLSGFQNMQITVLRR
jgi:hypothetical protein